MTQPIGILGGTFDPVHNGHLRLATTFIKELDLAEIRFVPLNNPPHRPAPVASSEQRLEMLKLAIANHAHFKVDDCELQREDISYTIDTLKLLRKNIGETPLCMLVGMDSFKTLNSWHQWRLLLDYSHIVIANRPGANEEMVSEIKELMNSHMTKSVIDLHQQAAGCIMKLDIAMLNISSTQIRNNFQSRLKSESLLPNKVLDFIQAHHLYNNQI